MSAEQNARRHDWLFYAGLLIITFAVFWPVSHCAFTNFDDPQFVTENCHLQDGWSRAGIAWAFREPVLGNWHPITSLSLLLNYQFFGNSAKSYHVVNLLFHCANVLLLFHVLRRMTGEIWPSALVAALFAVHPLQVESVAWVAERKNVMSAFFGLLTFWAYWRYQRPVRTGGRWVDYLLSVFFFALGLMSKPILVTWPFILLLLDFWPLQRINSLTLPALQNSKGLLLEKAPFFALSAAVSIVTIFTHKDVGDLAELNRLTIGDRIYNVSTSYVRYIGKIICPSHLAIPYPMTDSRPVWQTIVALLLLVSATILIIRQIRQRPYLVVGWFWFLVILVPVIGLVQEGSQSMADRHAYLACIGTFIMLVWGIKHYVIDRPRLQTGLITTSIVVLASFSLCSQRQLGYWQNSRLLFQHSLDVTGANILAQINLGDALIEEGKIDAGFANLNAVLQVDPTMVNARMLIAKTLESRGQFQDAINQYNVILESKPDCPEALNNLAWIYSSNPDANLHNGPRAVQLAQHACELRKFREAVYIGTLAAAYAEAGKFDEAITTAQQACDVAAKNDEPGLRQKNEELLERYRRHQTAVTDSP